MKQPRKVLFLLPYPLSKAPSQRFRVEAMLPLLQEAGISYTLRPFMSVETWQVLYRGGALLEKACGIIKGYLKRFKTVFFEAGSHDYIFIHREAAPLGPPLFEWILKKVLKKKIIFDFDDAIWIPNVSEQNKLASSLKAFWKVSKICRWSYIAVGGNDYLCNYAKINGAQCIVRIPTVVDMVHRYNRLKEHHNGKVIVGWTGSHSTLKYLDTIIPVMNRLQLEYDFTFLIIADKQPELSLRDWQFLPWNAATEIDDLMKMDIGLMPLTSDPWSEGKCGFKLIQYLSLGIPTVASAIGVNSIIVRHNVNGYIVHNTAEWEQYLKKLLCDVALRGKMGSTGKIDMENTYSISAQKDVFVGLFSD
jgi:glycosyltransferase involved in cell wall biosynthesis